MVIRRLLAALLLMVLLLFTLLTFLVGTGSGARLLVQVGGGFIPGELNIGHLEGNLLKGLTARDVRYRHDALTAELAHLEARVALLPLTGLRVEVLTLQAAELDLTLTPDPDAPPADGPFSLPDSIPMPVVVNLPDGHIRQIRFRTDPSAEPLAVDSLYLSLHLNQERALIRRLTLDSPHANLLAAGHIALTLPYSMALGLDWHLPLPAAANDFLPDADQAQGQLVTQGDLTRLTLRHQILAPLNLVTTGDIRDPVTHLTLDLTHHWQAFTIPLGQDQRLSVAEGRLITQGQPDSYRLNLDTGITLDEWPALALSLVAQGDTQALYPAPLAIRSEAGDLDLNGRISWHEGIHWAVELTGRHLAPGHFMADLPGHLQLALSSQGRLDEALGLVTQVDLQALSGDLRGFPVHGQGQVNVRGQRLTSPDLQLAVGNNHLNMRGEVTDHLDVALDLRAPDLPDLWPGLRGQLQAQGRIQGPLDSPQITATARGKTLGYGDLSLGQVDLDLQAGLSPQSPLTLNLTIAALTLEDTLDLTRLTLTGEGRGDGHRIHLDLDADQGQLGLSLAGGLTATDPPAWRGQLTRMNLDQPLAGLWQLATPVTLQAAPDRAEMGRLCLLQAPARLCLEGSWSEQAGGRGQLTLSDLALASLSPLLPPNLQLEGHLDAQAELRLDEHLRLEAQVLPSDGHLRILGQDGDEQTVPYHQARADVRIDHQDLAATLQLGFLEAGTLDARVALSPDADGALTLAGRARADLTELGWLDMLVPQIRHTSGRIGADLILGGTLAQPRMEGEIALTEARLEVPDLGITLDEMALTLTHQGSERLQFDGTVRSGPGRLALNGQVIMDADRGYPVTLTLRGDRFQAARRPDVTLMISPDLQLTVLGERLIVTGDITVPEASITLVELPQQAISVSRDEIIIDSDHGEAPLPLQVIARIRLILGDQVRISGFGLNARLGGNVMVQETPGMSTRLVGDIRVIEGRYKAYGQDLTVERGVILFQGPPDNPGLNLRALRQVPAHDVVVGLEIAGTLDAPRSRVFSDPPMEDSDALSFLVTGRPLSGARGETDANAILSAIAMYGIEQGGFITDRIGRQLGLDEFTVDTGTELEGAALMMGRYLSPRLYLRYAVGLFERSTTVMLNYQLSRTLSLETRSAADAQSMDLIYRRER
ncbi:translocation and assembly module TamB [Ectothiorhodospira magna]|uniref:Translocation and assembly module TamB n=1 Tax=Ectothiorhodospira magna TaxID=867345 RepID=A0A1H9BPY6_9GAMM|nr:translocation/assembly module TamB domain-containing protein [Ectothiorhodospira magna]SEP90468.1 translocation and assembly module TamB [Ectothiorhodospira magna]